MGRNKDQKARRKNAAGYARHRAEASNDSGASDQDSDAPDNDCPKCGAAAGEVCVTPSGATAKKTHADRLK